MYDEYWDNEDEDNEDYSGRCYRYENKVVSAPRGKRPRADILPIPKVHEREQTAWRGKEITNLIFAQARGLKWTLSRVPNTRFVIYERPQR